MYPSEVSLLVTTQKTSVKERSRGSGGRVPTGCPAGGHSGTPCKLSFLFLLFFFFFPPSTGGPGEGQGWGLSSYLYYNISRPEGKGKIE